MKALVALAVVLFTVALSAPAWSGTAAPGRAHSPMPVVPAEHVETHARMTEQMRVMGSDGRMGTDPVWERMRDDAHVRAEEHHQAGIDRMLARPSR